MDRTVSSMNFSSFLAGVIRTYFILFDVPSANADFSLIADLCPLTSVLCPVDLGKDFVHDLGRQNNLTIRERGRTFCSDARVKARDQLFHPGILIKPTAQKCRNVTASVSEVLAGAPQRWQEIREIA